MSAHNEICLPPVSDVDLKKVPIPPRHAEVVQTFSAVVDDLSDLTKVSDSASFAV
jgi:hypothetical protein